MGGQFNQRSCQQSIPAVSLRETESDQLLSRLLQRKVELEKCAQRDLVVLEGNAEFVDTLVKQLCADLQEYRLISDRFEAAIPNKKASSCLGQEAPWVIVDLFDGLDADVFCIAAGLVTAGGMLILLSPADSTGSPVASERLKIWQDGKPSSYPWFEHYLFETLRADDFLGSRYCKTGSFVKPVTAVPSLTPTAMVAGCTADQQRFLDEVKAWLLAKTGAVFMLLAERGRGKSTALGLLYDELQRAGNFRILVTAPSRQSASILLQRAPAAEFVAPDELLQSVPQADLLMVDEAAMIPQSMLRQICGQYSRSILATTTGGYEGTGQGFLLRFKRSFSTNQLLECVMHEPVRWCTGDRLESWLNNILLPASAMKPASPQTAFALPSLDFQLLTAGEDVARIREAYSLLSHAHYRTAPADLQMMLENPDLRLLLATHEGRIIAAALLNPEGGFDSELCDAVFLGKRRPKGHLLAQMITAQTGLREFARHCGLRIQRIAVVEAYRRLGVGTALTDRAQQLAETEGFDYLGASYAIDTGSLEFWSKLDFDPVCLSYAQGKSTGSHSLAVIKPLTEGLQHDCQQLVSKLRRQLPQLMLLSLHSMEAQHVVALLRYLAFEAKTDALEQNDLTAFIAGERGLDSCFASVQKQVMQAIAQSAGPIDDLLVYKAVLNRDWSRLPRSSGSEGRRQLQKRLRQQVEALVKA